ncbi:uncharacterized protein BO88DRAFT_406437 [Aspergillus vadensis CBS 113365]|uniref:Uncharacterized protein n=1 Tax=Aspergillus vadensis (strain CBS 113365 / IMI 142717 / IBT 24658) TaxID=1448311 RepID=A0A319CEH1_ASPVC|nr:hypothetical protein BO88DRAFT_406437 [Aspergillus vadensis CBS 113365]PYH66762.1 hypothetical protein BO88DRAFT_406437 [Aspergillus vadensis CBS 113365]
MSNYHLLEATNVDSLEKTADGLIYQAGLSSAVWEIGSQAICKVIGRFPLRLD